MKARVYSWDKKLMSQNGIDFEFVPTDAAATYYSTCLFCGVHAHRLCGIENECDRRDDGLVGYWKERP